MYVEHALSYAARGWHVFPLSPGQKIPRKGTKGVLEATADETQIKSWWKELPEANIAIACGAISNLFVVDIDPRHGGDKTLAGLLEQNGRMPSTVCISTGGGGIQLYFKHLEGLRSGAGKLGTGIDHRGDGGYVVAPPSLHPSGEHYSFYEDQSPDDVELADVPSWIVDSLGKPKERRTALEPEYYRDLFARGANEGERNDALVRMAGHLIRKKLDPFMVLDILKLWNEHRLTPPGSEEKLIGIVDRVAGRELDRITKRNR